MAEPAERRLLPDAISRKSFSNSFRGFDADEVRAFLVEIASAMREMERREGEQRRRADAAESRALKAENLDEARLTAALGEETARVFAAAREAAADVRAKAEDAVARLLREARDEATKLRADADALVGQRSEEAEKAADEIRKRADDDAAHRRTEADHVLAAAREEGDRLRKDATDEAERVRAEAREAADAEVEAAKETGRQLLAEAQTVRERVLRDLARKRKVARQQLEQLRAGRERLLSALEVVKEASSEATRELVVALPEARAAAEAAARRVEDEEPTIEELEAELAAGRDAGLPLIDTDADDDEPPAAEVVAEVLAEAPEVAQAAVEAIEAGAEAPHTAPVFDPGPVPPPEPLSTGRGERRSSALRVFRSRKPSVAEELPPSDESLPEVAPSAPFETVRIVAEPAADAGEPAASDDVTDLFARLRIAENAPTPVETAAEPEPQPEAVASADDIEATPPDAGAEADAEESVEADAAPEPTAETESLLERRDAITDEVEQRLAKRLKRVLADEQNGVLDLLRRTRKATVDDLLADHDAQAKPYVESAVPELRLAAAAGVGFFASASTPPVDVDDLAAELAAAIIDPLRARVERAVRDGGGDEETTADGIRSCYREWKTQKIGDVARHYVVAAFTRGGYTGLPDGSRVCWLVDSAGVPCPDAEDNALAGALTKGAVFPTGHAYPPAHPGCRCLLVPGTST